ncbi:hypothetical protein CN514_24590, partial [Bacillus sp. AFS001701]
MQMYDRAISDLNESIKLKPDYATSYSNLGLVYLDKQMYDVAISTFDKAIKLDPKQYMAYTNRGLAYY